MPRGAVQSVVRARLAQTAARRLEAAGSTVIDAQPDLRAHLAAESAKYRRMVEVAGIIP